MSLRVELLRAWPRRFESVVVELPAGARVADALRAAGWDEATPIAIYGRVAGRDAMLRDGDRVELLRPLVADPKEARRRRAAKA